MPRPFPILLVAVALLAASAGYLWHRHQVARVGQSVAPVVVASQAPTEASVYTWSFADLSGDMVPIERWRDRILVVNFWATWCAPCLREIPAFVDLQAQYADRGLQFVGIALDEAAAVAPFVVEQQMNYPVLVGDDTVIRYMQTLGNEIGGLPYTAVLDAAGTIRFTHQGEWPRADAEAAILEVLPEG